MTDVIPERITRLLLVEGKEDQEFFIQLGAHLNLVDAWPLRIVQYGGVSNLGERVRTLARPDLMEQVYRIGIVRDADFNTDALRSVQSAIQNANRQNEFQLNIPQAVMEFTNGAPSLGVLILPSAEREGMIEDLIMGVFHQDPVSSCVDRYFKCLREENIGISQERLPKARLRTFITGKNIGSESEGEDSDRQYLSDVFHMTWWRDEFWDDPVFDEAKTFLTQLLAP